MAKYIDREIATRIIDNYAKTISKDCLVVYQAIRDIVDTICPTIEAKPVVYAHWIEGSDEKYYCHNCGYPAEGNIADYAEWCPVCGAQMDEVASDNNVGSKGVKIPVISMEDVPKLAKEMEK